MVGARGVNTAYLYYGNDAARGGDAGLDREVRQWRVDGSARVAEGGVSDSPNAIRIQAMGRSPAGRDKVRFEWQAAQVEPVHQLSWGGTRGRTSALDTGVPGSQGCRAWLDQVMDGLASGAAYRWRVRTVSSSPYFPRSPWMWVPGKHVEEVHFRTPSCSVPGRLSPLGGQACQNYSTFLRATLTGSVPAVGTTMTISVNQAPPFTPVAAVLIDFQLLAPGGVDLGLIGGPPSCVLWPNPVATLPFTVSSLGNGSTTLAIGPSALQIGLSFNVQAVFADPASPYSLPIVVSEAKTGVIGACR
jgi:hypothetical protein